MTKKILPFLFLLITAYASIAQSGSNTIITGAKLTEGQRLVSANKNYYLAMQADGNLCIYTSSNAFVWCSMLYIGKGSYLTMQSDGNLVVYDGNNQPVWNTMTQSFYDPKFASAEWKAVRAVLEDNGTLCLYTAANKKVWTNTDKKEAAIEDPGVGFTGQSVKKDLNIKLPGSKAAGNYIVEINNRGEVFYNGDMNLGTVENLTKKSSAPPEPDNSFKWPNSIVPYYLPNNHLRKDIIQKGIEFLNTYTTLCLVPRTPSDKDYVEFMARDGNWSMIGRTGGKQEISIENNNIGTVIHEVMHALGFHHTQCREDRDNYVTINMSNVQKGKEHNFQKSKDKQSNLGAYDYTSCMHYASYGFAVKKGLKTIVRKDGKTEEMGQWDGMSATDVANIAAIYPKCPSKSGVKPLPDGEKTQPTTTTPPATATCEGKDAVTKYKTSMKLGNRLFEKEKLVSANGQFQLRGTTDGNFVIEEILSGGNCPYKETFRFPQNNGGSKPSVSFLSYNPDGNICMDSKLGKTYCATNGVDNIANVILSKSQRLELTNDGRLILVGINGEEIWATSPSRTSPTTTTPATRVAPPTTPATTRTKVLPPTTPTSIRVAKPIEPIVDPKKPVPIPPFQPGSEQFKNLVFELPNVKTHWWSVSSEDAGNSEQVIDGHTTNDWSEEPHSCQSGEGLTPGWEIDLGQAAYVEYIVIWNNTNPSSLNGRNFYVHTGATNLPKRLGYNEPALNHRTFFMNDKGSDGFGLNVEPLGPYKWDTGKKSMIIPIKRNVRLLSISLQKDGIKITPLCLEEVEIYGKKQEPRRR